MNARAQIHRLRPATPQQRPIGAILVGEGHMQARQVPMVLMAAQRAGKRFGESAVELGLVEQQVVNETLLRQVGCTPVLHTLSKQALTHELVTLSNNKSSSSAGFKALSAQLLLAGESKTLAVVSPERGNGRSFVAANLAMAFAQTGRRTLLVDAHFEAPRQQEIFGLQDQAGLTELIHGQMSQPGHIFRLTAEKNLSILPAGCASGTAGKADAELITRKEARSALQAICKRYEMVVFDTPAVQDSAMPYWIARMCGSALMVAEAKKTRMQAIKQLEERLTKYCKIAGVVLNNKH